ncbi:hypothetical protein [Membranihabitans marinus]|uniref:hypothetical protein n=1 Tax=Membranihabitans marinus TaxID=1227546 RepID=UPI001F3D45F1|nr:hypothetical protein [Membranihabitans marinus]
MSSCTKNSLNDLSDLNSEIIIIENTSSMPDQYKMDIEGQMEVGPSFKEIGFQYDDSKDSTSVQTEIDYKNHIHFLGINRDSTMRSMVKCKKNINVHQ